MNFLLATRKSCIPSRRLARFARARRVGRPGSRNSSSSSRHGSVAIFKIRFSRKIAWDHATDIRATARVNFHDERPSGAGTIARGMDDRSPSNRVQPLRRPLLVARGSLKRQVARKGQDTKEGEAGDSEQGHCWD